MPAGWWQERPLKCIKLLSSFIPRRIIDQSKLWCCFNNVQFTIHWLPSTHSIINFTDLFGKAAWLCTVWAGAVSEEGCRERRTKKERHLFSSLRVAGSCTSGLANREPGSITRSSRKTAWKELGHPTGASRKRWPHSLLTLLLSKPGWSGLCSPLPRECTTDEALLSGVWWGTDSLLTPYPTAAPCARPGCWKPQKKL